MINATAQNFSPKTEAWIAGIAQSQYYHRPNDEKYTSLDDFRQVCTDDKKTCRTAHAPAGSLRVETTPDNKIAIVGPSGIPAIPTNYGFRQLCSLVGAPASYLPTLPPGLAADCLRHSFGKMEEETRRTRHQLYLSTPDGSEPTTQPEAWRLRAITSDEYARVYDQTLAEIACTMRDRYGLDLPPTWEGTRGGAYRSDRDSFVLLTSGGSIVTDPSVASGNDGRMFRGVILRNSEVGHATLSFTCFLYRVVCGNHAIWNPRGVMHFNRKHIGRNFVADFARAVDRARAWLDSPESTDRATIDRLINANLAETEEDAIAQARKIAPTLSQTQAEQAIRLATQHEQINPLSPWGFVQGLTRLSQTAGHMDARHAIDSIAAKITNRYAYA